MTNVNWSSITQYQDIDTLNAFEDLVNQQKRVTSEKMMTYVHHSSRDNARTPMQWDSSENAGFTKGKPWLGVNDNYSTINVAQSLADQQSIFYFYKKLITLRQQMPIITNGHYQVLDMDDESVYAYNRIGQDSELLIISNFTDQIQTRHYSLKDSANLLISNYEDDQGDVLRPYESKVYFKDT